MKTSNWGSSPDYYIYDADYHCPKCTEEDFGSIDGEIAKEPSRHKQDLSVALGVNDPEPDNYYKLDHEGNEVSPGSSMDEWWSSYHDQDDWPYRKTRCEWLSCGDCGDTIDEVHDDVTCDQNHEGDCKPKADKIARIPSLGPDRKSAEDHLEMLHDMKRSEIKDIDNLDEEHKAHHDSIEAQSDSWWHGKGGDPDKWESFYDDPTPHSHQDEDGKTIPRGEIPGQGKMISKKNSHFSK